jgi:hypothetical protein
MEQTELTAQTAQMVQTVLTACHQGFAMPNQLQHR